MKDAPRDPEHIEYETRLAQAMAEIIAILDFYDLYHHELTAFCKSNDNKRALFVTVLPLDNPGKALNERIVRMVLSPNPIPEPEEFCPTRRKVH